jgi:hypothetical protein
MVITSIFDGGKMKKKRVATWTTSDGREIKIDKMAFDHLLNAVNHLEKLAIEKRRAVAILGGPSQFPYRQITSLKELYRTLNEMSDSEVASYFFPKYPLLIAELDSRNKLRMRELLQGVQDQVIDLGRELDAIKGKLNL